MKNNLKEISMKDKKADIFTEYQRLKEILKQIHILAASWSEIGVNVIPNHDLKPILKKPKPFDKSENQKSMQAISENSVCDGRDTFARIKMMAKKSIGNSTETVSHESIAQPSAADNYPKGNLNERKTENRRNRPVISLFCDTNIRQHKQKVKQGRVEQPLRRSQRIKTEKPDFLTRFLVSKAR